MVLDYGVTPFTSRRFISFDFASNISKAEADEIDLYQQELGGHSDFPTKTEAKREKPIFASPTFNVKLCTLLDTSTLNFDHKMDSIHFI
jgi:hypothetical protein